ncbi:MAG: YjbQ family protein [Coriobacteriia bacterium]|nr:YjbQ family protein [Coriobacteriia bacterium]
MRFEVHTQRREQMVDVTREVLSAVAKSGVREGCVVVFCPHTTAAVTVNEVVDPDVATDILSGLARLIPNEGPWSHAGGNADAHLKATLVGSSVTLPIVDGEVALGSWQGIFLCDFDGPRRRSLTAVVSARGVS